MILSLILSGASFVTGIVTGVYMREHDMLTVADIRSAADRLIAAAPKLSPNPETPTVQS